MGTVVRDWRLGNRSARRRARRRTRPSSAAAEQVGHEVRFAPRARAARPRTLRRLALVLVPLLLLVAWVWWLGAERRAIRALPAAERAAVFAQAMRGFEDLCAPPRDGLEQHCRREASFLVSFPECDEHCLRLTRPILLWRS